MKKCANWLATMHRFVGQLSIEHYTSLKDPWYLRIRSFLGMSDGVDKFGSASIRNIKLLYLIPSHHYTQEQLSQHGVHPEC